LNRIDQERAIYWSHPIFADVGFLKASYVRHRYDLHTHPTYVFGLVTRGVERLRAGGSAHVAPAGSLIIVNPEVAHDGEAGIGEGWSYRTCYPTQPFMSDVMRELGRTTLPEFRDVVISDRSLLVGFLAAHLAAERGDPIDAEARLLSFVRELVLKHGSVRPSQAGDAPVSGQAVLACREIVEAKLSERLDLAMLAHASGVTRFQVIRNFKKVTGLTPGGYIRVRRVERAAQLIADGTALSEVAVACGFADQSHLTRTFRALRGMTPSIFREALISRDEAGRSMREGRAAR